MRIVGRIIRLQTSVREYKEHSNIIMDTKCSLHFRTKIVHDKYCGTARFVPNSEWHARNTHGKRTMPTRILTGANEVGGHDGGKRYLLSTYYSSTL